MILGDRQPETQEGKIKNVYIFWPQKWSMLHKESELCFRKRELVKQHLTKKQSGNVRKTDCIEEEFA